jgi:hypothetical protein
MKKLLEVQKKIGAISKDSTNPFFKSKYFDINKLLEEVKPVLNELGLILLQPLDNINGKPAIRTMIIDSATGSTLTDNTITLPEISDPQKMGSAITYYRRYAIQSLLGLQAEDDDGNLAAKPEPVKKFKSDKEIIAKLLNNASPMPLVTTEDYKQACFDLTGIVLAPQNYKNILTNLMK